MRECMSVIKDDNTVSVLPQRCGHRVKQMFQRPSKPVSAVYIKVKREIIVDSLHHHLFTKQDFWDPSLAAPAAEL